MRTLLSIPVLRAVALLWVIHAVACLLVAGPSGLKETAVFGLSLVGVVFVSRAETFGSLLQWMRSYPKNFKVWVGCTAIMTAFLVYRSAPRVEIAFLESMTAAAFFALSVCAQNRFFSGR